MTNFTNSFRLFFRNGFKKNNILLKLIASFVLPTVAIIMAISVFFSAIYSNKSMQDINSISYLTLSNVGTSLNNYLESSKQIAYQIYKNQNVIPLFYLYPTNEDKCEAVAYINNVIISNPQLYSVYLFSDNKMVLDFGGSSLFTDSNEEISSLIKQSENLKPKPRKIKNNNGVMNLITTIYSQNFGEDNGNYIVLNFKPDNLHNQVNEGFLKTNQSLVITDRLGNILAHSNKGMFSNSISQLEFFKNISESSFDHGGFKSSIDGKPSIVNYLFMDNKSYIVFFVSDYNSFFQQIIETRNTIILFCLIALFLLAIVSILISYKIYNPISKVFTNIRNLIGGDTTQETKISHEVKFIAASMSNFVERLNNLQEDSTRNFNSLRNNFIHKLLLSQTSMSQKDFEEGVSNYKIDKGQGYNYQIIVLRIDNCSLFLEKNSKESINFQLGSVESIAHEVLSPVSDSTSFSIDLEHIIILANYPFTDNNSVKVDVFLPLMKNLQETIYQLFNMSISVGISDPLEAMSLSEMKSKYNQAYTLTNYRLIRGKGLVFYSGSINIKDIKNDKISSVTNAILNSIKTGSLEQYETNINILFNTINSFSYEKIIDILLHLAESIVRISDELLVNNPNVQSRNIEQMYQKIKSFEEYSEIKDWFISMFAQTTNLITSLKNTKAMDLFDSALKYINENYYDSSLSATMMANKLGITPQYFSKMFGQFTGVSFPDYINNIRLEKAKDILISKPLLSITSVCEKTGYNSTSYFTKAFTKKFGIPPSKYSITNKEGSIRSLV